jgi:hypothetical protein
LEVVVAPCDRRRARLVWIVRKLGLSCQCWSQNDPKIFPRSPLHLADALGYLSSALLIATLQAHWDHFGITILLFTAPHPIATMTGVAGLGDAGRCPTPRDFGSHDSGTSMRVRAGRSSVGHMQEQTHFPSSRWRGPRINRALSISVPRRHAGSFDRRCCHHDGSKTLAFRRILQVLRLEC